MKNKGRTFAIGDIHGNHKGFIQALERSGFDNERDTLISLGDVVDGHCDSYLVIEELLKIKNLISIKGNHDKWFHTFLLKGQHPAEWLQGGQATAESYLKVRHPDDYHLFDYFTGNKRCRLNSKMIPESHLNFFDNQLDYYLDNDNNLFVHAGFNRHYPLEDQGDILWWDRDLWSQALSFDQMTSVEGIKQPKFKMVGDFKEVFIGHTPTQFWGKDEYMKAANIYNIDCGGGWFGRICILDVDTKEAFYSDEAKLLYPDFKGR